MVQRQDAIFNLMVYETIKDAFEKHANERRFFTMEAAQRAGDEAVAAGAACYDIEINRF